MPLAQSKVTSQGQISIPAKVRQKLGIGPGSVVEWDEEEGKITVRRAGKFTFMDIHKRAFPEGTPAYRTDEEIKAGIEDSIQEKFAYLSHGID